MAASDRYLLIAFIALYAIIPLAILTNANTPKNTKSEGKNVSSNNSTDSEIARLTSEIEGRRAKAEAWDTWNIRLLFLAGFAATLLVVTAVGVSRSNRNLIESSDQLDRAKDRKLQDDLKSKDDEIAKLDNESSKLTASNLRLEAAIAPRRLSEGQTSALASLTGASNRIVAIKSYGNDIEGLVLASQILNALSRSSGVRVQDNRLTMQSSGEISFGVLVDGPDKPLVESIKKALSLGEDLTKGGTVSSTAHLGVSAHISFGVISSGPVAATITVGVKPIK